MFQPRPASRRVRYGATWTCEKPTPGGRPRTVPSSGKTLTTSVRSLPYVEGTITVTGSPPRPFRTTGLPPTWTNSGESQSASRTRA